jgi:dTDP-glucose pyrophosphorylase
MNNKPIGIILSAGKVHESLYPIFGEVNNGLVPVKGKPSILYILEQYKQMGLEKVYISVGYDKENLTNIVLASFEKELDIQLIEVDYEKKPGFSLLKIIKKINRENNENKSNDILITLADSLVTYDYKKMIEQGSTVLISNDFEISGYWCGVIKDKKGIIKELYEKDYNTNIEWALVGVYYLENVDFLNNMDDNNYQISDILKYYIEKKEDIKILEPELWFDTGHLNKYYQSKKQMMSSRYFNSFEYDDILGTVKKKSTDKKKLRDEIIWYENIPKKLKVLIPKIIDYQIDGDVSIEMEYYGYPSLLELWLYGNLSTNIWENIIKRVVKLINLFRSYKGNVSIDDYNYMYYTKTLNRIKDLKKINPQMKKLLDYEYIFINGEKLNNWSYFESQLKNLVNGLYNEKDNCILHGDMCFSNTLFDLNNGIIRLIDPRGEWGENILYGDIKYDIAKLRHSISGKYDFIVNDLFNIELNGNNIDLEINLLSEMHKEISKEFDSIISKYYDLNKVKIIEGLLFISMLPLHNDTPNRQIAMFSRGIQNLNEVLD